jgi:lysophospholipase L1-like esterase
MKEGRIFSRAASLALACVFAVHSALLAQSGASSDHWVGTWATAPVARAPLAGGPPVRGGRGGAAPLNFNNQTLREIVHGSIGGGRVRVVFSNVFGTAPLAIGAAHVGLREKDSAIVPTSGRALTFGGGQAVTIPAGAVLFSDPVNLTVPPLADLAIDIYLPDDIAASTSPVTLHNGARQTSYVSPAGNHAGAPNMPVQTTTSSWFFLSRVEVTAPAGAGALVMFGDSITDGFNSTPDANNRWPDDFARRLRNRAGQVETGVLNLGIDGNRVLADGSGVSALTRFDRDVLVQTGVTHVVLLEGINDLGMSRQGPRPTAADLTAGHVQLIARARARGLRVYGATLLPFEGTTYAGYWSPEGEATRQKFNEWILTSHAYDGVIDFDAAVRDPNHPTRLLPEYDSGDHLHPNDRGYQAMANAVNLALFGRGK